MSKVKKQNRVTAAQQAALCDFFEENPEVIRGYKKKPDCIEAVQRKWKNITPTLNSYGPPRYHKAWAKYLCDLKAKLKRKRITWKQREDGTGPLMCNADEFSEICLRMLQVLRNEQEESESASQDAMDEENTLEVTINDDESDEKEEGFYVAEVKTVCTNTQSTEKSSTISEQERQLIFVNESNDEFDTFGRNVAQQLRSLPLTVALETQEILLSILRKQRLKLPLESSADPLIKLT